MLLKKLACIGMLLSVHCYATDNDLFKQLNECKAIKSRLERLDCFDNAVGTPIDKEELIESQHFPSHWYYIYSIMNTSKNTSKDRHHLYVDKNKQHNAWIGIKSQALNLPQNLPQFAVLLLNCTNNLSRVEVILPFKVNAHTLYLHLDSKNKNALRSDDIGVIFSSARGLPAIKMIKAIALKNSIQINLNEKNIKHIEFDIDKLSDYLPDLRQSCGW